VSRKHSALRSHADRVASTCYVVRLRAFNRLISGIYNKSLANSNLTISQFNILTAVVKREPVAATQICSALHLEKSTLSRNIRLMRQNGWVCVETQGRTILISMTNKGRSIYETALPLWERAQQQTRESAGEEIFQRIASTVQSLKRQ